MKIRSMFFVCTLAAGSLFAQQPQQPATTSTQNPAYGEQVDVNLVLVDATVTDRKGNQILGLSKDDFIVKENGVAQDIASAEYFTNRTLLNSPESKAAFKVERVRDERYFIFFFDRSAEFGGVRSARSEMLQVREAAKKFVKESMKPEDRAAVMAYDARLKILSDFTGDKSALMKALDQVTEYGIGITTTEGASGDESILAHIDMKKVIDRTGRIYDAIRLVADATRQIKARKVMMLVSAGIGTADTFNPEILVNEDTWYDPMLAALNRANVTVDTIHLLRNTRYHTTEQTLSRLADETSGQYYRNMATFQTPFTKIENYNNGYYLLTYYAKHPKGTTGYQKISVSLKNPEFRVVGREGYAY